MMTYTRFSPVVELRQYTLCSGQRDALIELFERELIESQEALGAQVIGQFRDLDRPDRFVWLRGFDDMRARRQMLTDFYDGAVWKAHREAANATMIDSDNVLLLRPAGPDSAFALDVAICPSRGTAKSSEGIVTCMIWDLEAGSSMDFIEFFERSVAPALKEADARILGYFETETAPNDYPRLPVREGENVFVCFTCQAERIVPELTSQLTRRLGRVPEILRLAPTARSLLRA